MDPDYVINDNIQENYLKALKEDSRTTENLKDRHKDKGDKLIDLTVEQNKKVLYYSSKVYESMLEHFDNSNNELYKLDTLIENLVDQQRKLIKRKPQRKFVKSGDDNLNQVALKEFEKKIEELQKANKICEDKIALEKKTMTEYEDKSKEVHDYINKFILEKRLYLDKVDEEAIRELSKS